MSFSESDLEEFKAEALELLEVAEKSLLALDQGAEFKGSFDSIFRCFHNLKGAAGMMDLQKLQTHTHELETIFMSFKSKSHIPKEYINLFLSGVDAARTLLDGQDVQFSFEVSASVNSSVHSIESTPVVEVTMQSIPEPATQATETQAASVTESAATNDLPQAAVDEFVSESEEIIERVSKNLQLLESNKFSKESVDELYRDVHSLKGAAYLFSFAKLGDVGHAMESSLEKVRSQTHLPSSDLLNALFKCVDLIEQFIQRIKEKKSDQDLNASVPTLCLDLAFSAEQLEAVGAAPSMSVVAAVSASVPVEIQMSEQPKVEVHHQANAVHAEAAESNPVSKEAEGVTSIRVPVNLLDNLMTLMGEMVLVRNQVLQYSNQSDDLEFLSMSKRLNVVTSEIQGEMMKTRMQPIGNVLSKFNRVVRDLSHELHKNISLNLQGSDTELDKSLLEAIKDPLTHIVRNSCDHGIETPDIRRAAGKSESGTINIKAYHEGGQVVIEVADNGKGLHKDTLVKKAIEKGLITQAQATKLSEKEIYNLIFAPGFSTAAKITNVSGRGVGMDVVRTNIEKIGGTVDLSSESGKGTAIKIKIPLTLAIVPALIVKSGEGTFAIPQVKLEELVRVDQVSSENKVEMLHGAPVFRLRGNILPLVDLNQVLHTSPAGVPSYENRTLNIAVLNAEQCLFGLIIDEVKDTADIVVKPLNRLLKSLQVYSGATILGDGSVGLILDVLGISKVAMIGQDKTLTDNLNLEIAEKNKQVLDLQDFLLVKLASPTKHAIALSYVHRLEEFKRDSIEYSASQMVIRYNNVILPLVMANEHLGYGETAILNDTVQVVVIQKAGALYGIVVNEILDTLSTTVEMDNSLVNNPALFGNLNLKEELVVVVNPFVLINRSSGKDDSSHANLNQDNLIQQNNVLTLVKTVEAGRPLRILLVEDTAFFRRTIQSVLEKAGYEVSSATDGRNALEVLNKNENSFDLIISDIEMPNMNGFQLAEAVRKIPQFSKIGMMAVSSRADKQYILNGTKAGFDVYLEKLKPEILLAEISNLMQKKRSVA